MAGLRDRLRKALLGAAGGGRAKQLKNLEERASRPTKAERVVVRPDRKVKKRK